MRVDNVKITMEIPVHFNEPDKNGYVYTKESWEEMEMKISSKFLECCDMVELLKKLNLQKMLLQV